MSTISATSLLLLFSTLASFTSVALQSEQRARHRRHLQASIQKNANSLQSDPMSFQCYPNRAVQPSWNQDCERFQHSYWDVSNFIVRNNPYFTRPSPAASITLALPGLKQHISPILEPVFTAFQSERRYPGEEGAHQVGHQSWRTTLSISDNISTTYC